MLSRVAGARRALAIAVVASVVVTVGALVIAARMRSPAQVAAETAPPARSVLTEPVQKRVLTATVVVRGQIGAEQTVDVVARGSTDGAPVVTAVKVKYGDQVAAAQVLMEISGRPVFAMAGTIPAYRDLRPGDTGKDVAQLRACLASLGFPSTDAAETYGPSTKHAVADLYRSRGYTPKSASEQDDKLLAAAQSAVTTAERALRDAKTARDDAVKANANPPANPVGDAQAGSTPTGGTQAGGANDGGKGLAALNLAVSDRTEDLAKARTERTKVQQTTGPMVPAGEMVFLSGFPGRVDTVSTTVGATAQAKLMTISAGRLVVKGQLTAYQKGLIRPGQQVSVLSEISGSTAEATVQSVADTPHQPEQAVPGGQQGGGAPAAGPATGVSYDLIAAPTGTLDPSLAGQDVRLTINAASSGDQVLVVPLAAVSAGADAKTSVTVVSGGNRRRVEIVPGLVGDGYVQVTPVGGATLQPGDQVVVGS